MKLAGMSDIGLIRQQNQDNYAIVTSNNGDKLAMVCDGIGGALSGDVASLCAVRYMSEVFGKHNGFSSLNAAKIWIEEKLNETNDLIFTKMASSKEYEGMGTTFVGLMILDVGVIVANVGDSRAYSLQDEHLIQITEDHSLVTELLSKGEITKEESLSHPQRNVLTNALGVVGNLRVDIFELSQADQTVLLCTDGLSGYVSAVIIEKILNDSTLSLNKKLKLLIDAANNAGGYDNTTVVLCEALGDQHD